MHTAQSTSLFAITCFFAAVGWSLPAAALTQCGEASWYERGGSMTASGETVDPKSLTAAHRSIPFGDRVLVENLDNGQVVTVTINDRGPFVDGRIIDISRAAADKLQLRGDGVARVRISTLDPQAKSSKTTCR